MIVSGHGCLTMDTIVSAGYHCQWAWLSLDSFHKTWLSLGTVVTGCDYLLVVANSNIVFDSLKSIWSLSGRLLYLVSVVLVVVSLCPHGEVVPCNSHHRQTSCVSMCTYP